MKNTILAFAFLVTSQVSEAVESCPMKVTDLLNAGGVAELSAMFEKSSMATQEELRALAGSVGKLSKVVEAVKPRFVMHKRLSVKSQDLPSRFTSQALRANAVSSQLGEVQVHVDVKPGTQCTVLAVHIDQSIQ